LADRYGAMRVIMLGSVLYALGLVGMGLAATGWQFTVAAGLVIGAAQAGTTYAVVYGVIGRQISAEKRSWAMGVAAAAGSFGQFLMVPIEGWLISSWGWQQALLILAAVVLVIAPLAWGLREPGFVGSGRAVRVCSHPDCREAADVTSYSYRNGVPACAAHDLVELLEDDREPGE
jgi:MFS family permease